jgi:hypothetical protein
VGAIAQVVPPKGILALASSLLTRVSIICPTWSSTCATSGCELLYSQLLAQITYPLHFVLDITGTLYLLEEQFRAHEIATASLCALRETCVWYFHSEANLLRLKPFVQQTIGITNVDRLRGLKVEQESFIKEMRLVQEHIERLDTEIADIVKNCRQGQILLSIPSFGEGVAATIIATIDNIANFEKASELKCYFGWAPRQDRTGASFNRTRLAT